MVVKQCRRRDIERGLGRGGDTVISGGPLISIGFLSRKAT